MQTQKYPVYKDFDDFAVKLKTKQKTQNEAELYGLCLFL